MPLGAVATAELEEVFLSDVRARLDGLAARLDELARTPAGKRDAASLEAHSIRGAAAMTGHGEIAGLCGAVEELLEEDAPEPDELRAAGRLLREARKRLPAPAAFGSSLLHRLLPRRFIGQLTLILALATLPSLGITVYDALSGRANGRDRIRTEATTDVQLAASAQLEVLLGGRRLLDALGQTTEVQGGDATACRRLLGRYAAGFAPFVDFAVAGPAGDVTCASYPLSRSGPLPLFESARATNRFSVGSLARGRTGGGVVRIAEPVARPGGKVVVGAAIDIKGLQGLLDAAKLPPAGTITVIDHAGRILARRPPALLVGTRVSDATLRSLHGSAGTTAETKGSDGVPRVYAYHSAGPWYVTVGIPTASEYALLASKFVRETLIIGGLGLLGFIIALLGARFSLGLPLRSLVATTRRLGHGELSARTELGDRRGEFGELAGSIDAMAAALERNATERELTLDQLARHAAELEERVRARTADAEQARALAERSNEAKSAFMSHLSHELRTPLNGIRGFATLLARSDLGPEDHEAARQVSSGAEHMTLLVDEVLDTARIEAGQFRVQLEPVRVADVVEDVVTFATSTAREHGVTVTWSAEDPEIHAVADRQRLSQTLINLVNNAVLYNRPGGSVAVGVERGDPGHVLVDVVDTGVGIAGEDLERVFTPYDRLGRGPESSGLGLGLALSQRLVDAMGGTISVESKLGKGSRFIVELLDSDGHEEPAPAPPTTRTGVETGGRVLYIDDDATSRKLLELVLAERAVDFVGASSGAQGLELAREHRPDLVVLDLRLSDGSGLDVLRTMRGDETLRAVPIVMLSGDAERDTVKALLEAGADDYLTKPLDLDRAEAMFDRFLLVDRKGSRRTGDGVRPQEGKTSGMGRGRSQPFLSAPGKARRPA